MTANWFRGPLQVLEVRDRALERGDACPACEQPDGTCHCDRVTRLPVRLALITEQPSQREREEHAKARVIDFPTTTNNGARATDPDAA
jgi:hypothetical protein